MASLMDDLLDVIEQEENHYRKLIGLSTDKKDAIIKGDIRRLEDITNEEQDVTSILKNLETKRSGVLADMADVLGQDAETLTVRKMIDLLEKQPNEQKKLSDLCDRLRHTLDEMSAVNEQNRVLLEQALEMVANSQSEDREELRTLKKQRDLDHNVKPLEKIDKYWGQIVSIFLAAIVGIIFAKIGLR